METTVGKDFMVPDLGEGLEELTILRWLAAPGDVVALNQPLCLVETEKAEVEIPSPHSGTLVSLGGADGETLRVGALLARFDIGESAPEVAAPTNRPQPTLVGYGLDESIDRSRRRRRGTGQAAPPAAPATATVPDAPAVAASAVAAVAEPQPGAVEAEAGGRPRAKPPVRKLARDLGVDLHTIGRGSGPVGDITRDDVRRAAEQTAPSAEPVVALPDTTTTTTTTTATAEVIAVKGVRARIAEKMTLSRQRIPDATCSVVVDCTRLMEVRSTLVASGAAGSTPLPVTPFSLICSMAVHALRVSPLLNATFVESVPEIRVHPQINLGIGTATDRGLIVTVVKHAGARSVLDLSKEMARLTAAARAGTLAPADMSGSTFTVSNFGALGLDEGIPVINHPEAAILGVGSVKARPHVVDGAVVARQTSSFTLAFDHRVCDGAEAGRFLSELRRLVESPELLLLDR